MMRRAKFHANRLSVYIFFILLPLVLWKMYTDDTEQKMRHLRNALEDIERVQKYTSGKLELISRGLDKLAKVNQTKLEISSIRNIKKSLTSISFPGPAQFLDHLPHDFSYSPLVDLGPEIIDVDYLLGIPTVKRELHSYLLETVESVLQGTSSFDGRFALVIYVGDDNEEAVKQIYSDISEKFPNKPIKVISPPAEYYPNWAEIDENNINSFGDGADRIKWRRKQNLDYLFLWSYSIGRSRYFIQLEDDIVAKPDYLTFVDKAITNEPVGWLMLEFSSLGFIGKCFRDADLKGLANFVMLFYKEKPVDWLLENYLSTKVCSPEKSDKECASSKHKIKRTKKPSQFQHVGKHSSLNGKVQNLRDGSFSPKKGKSVASRTPELASMFTNIPAYKKYTLERFWQNKCYFWGTNVEKGAYIILNFNDELVVSRVAILTGGEQNPTDKMPENSTISLFEHELKNDFSDVLAQENGKMLGTFGVDGRFIQSFESPIIAKSLLIQVHSPSSYWLSIYDISISTA